MWVSDRTRQRKLTREANALLRRVDRRERAAAARAPPPKARCRRLAGPPAARGSGLGSRTAEASPAWEDYHTHDPARASQNVR